MKINLSPKAVTSIFITIVTLLATAHIAQVTLYHFDIFDYSRFLDFDTENNLPSFYSAMAIEFCALLLLVIYWHSKNADSKEAGYWLGLAIIFAFLGFDETAQMHEIVSDFFILIVDATGVLYFPWVIPYGLATGLVALIYWPWLQRLPQASHNGFIIAGGVFVSGAIGMEMISASIADAYSVSDWRYTIFYTAEEILEMSGIVLFIRALVRHIGQHIHQVTFDFSEEKTAPHTF